MVLAVRKDSWEDAMGSIADLTVRWNEILASRTSFRIGGPAECLVDLEGEADLLALFEVVEKAGAPYLVMGKGSNILIPDEGVPGVVIRLGKSFQQVSRQGNRVSAGCGCVNARFVEICRGWGLGGMEFLIAVPGTIGGAIAMNAGAHAGETAEFLRKVRLYRFGQGIVEEDATSIEFAYRSSPLRGQAGVVVMAGEFEMLADSEEGIKQRIEQFQTYRRETQPRDYPNCGSVFKNPADDFAARLIEEAGLKGQQLGGAQVSEKHANFIVNRGGASASEVLALVDLIRERVYSLNRVELELELQVL